MEFADAVRKRRMVRRYLDKPVDQPIVKRITEAGSRGPSAGFAQGVEFVVVQSEPGRQAIADNAGEAGYIARGLEPWLSIAPVHIVVTVDPARYEDRYSEPDKMASAAVSSWATPYWFVDAGAALMLLLLAAVDEGLSAGFLGSHAFSDLNGLVEVPASYETIGVVTLGYAADERPVGSALRPRRETAALIHHEIWSG